MDEPDAPVENPPAQTTCQAGIDPHNYASHMVEGAMIKWVKICTSCGKIDEEDLIAQQTKLCRSNCVYYAQHPYEPVTHKQHPI